MKITTTYLRQVIKEELSAVLREEENNPEASQKLSLEAIIDMYEKEGIKFYKGLNDSQIGFRQSVESIKNGLRNQFKGEDKKELESFLGDAEGQLEKMLEDGTEKQIRAFLAITKAISELVEEAEEEGEYL